MMAPLRTLPATRGSSPRVAPRSTLPPLRRRLEKSVVAGTSEKEETGAKGVVDAQLIRDCRKMYVYVFANSYRKIAAIPRYVIRRLYRYRISW